MRDPLTVIAELYADEISAGIATDWDGGLKAWIGNEWSGHLAEKWFDLKEIDQVGEWLHHASEELNKNDNFQRRLEEIRAERLARRLS